MRLTIVCILALAVGWLLMDMAKKTAERIAHNRVELIAP